MYRAICLSLLGMIVGCGIEGISGGDEQLSEKTIRDGQWEAMSGSSQMDVQDGIATVADEVCGVSFSFDTISIASSSAPSPQSTGKPPLVSTGVGQEVTGSPTQAIDLSVVVSPVNVQVIQLGWPQELVEPTDVTSIGPDGVVIEAGESGDQNGEIGSIKPLPAAIEPLLVDVAVVSEEAVVVSIEVVSEDGTSLCSATHGFSSPTSVGVVSAVDAVTVQALGAPLAITVGEEE